MLFVVVAWCSLSFVIGASSVYLGQLLGDAIYDLIYGK